MWDLSGAENEPVSFVLQGGFLTIGPPGKPLMHFLTSFIQQTLQECLLLLSRFSCVRLCATP